MKHLGTALGLGTLMLFSGCSVLEFVSGTDSRNPDSALRGCNSIVRDSDGIFTTKDPLACDCKAIDGRDPKCWGYTEYRNRPMPLASTLGSEPAAGSEPPRVAQAGGPEIPLNGIVNAASFASRILAAGAIARGSIFTIFGSGIGPAAGVAVTSFPLGTELGGVRIRVFTLDGEAEAIPLFVSSGQINAIMASDAPLGYVAVEVIFGGRTSNVAPVQVVDAAVGIFTSTGTGTGPASVTNFVSQTEQPPNSRATPASPSQFVTLWITGLGPVTGGDNMRPIDIGAVVDVRDKVALEIFVGSRRVTNIFYAGRSAEFAGLDQAVFEVPADVELGCDTPVNIRANGRPANGTTMAIAADGSPCPRVANALVLPGSVDGIVGGVSFLRLAGSTRGELEDPFADFAVEQGTAVFAANPPGPGGFSIFTNLPPVGTCVSSAGLSQDGEASGSVTSLETNVDAGTEITLTRTADGEQRVISVEDGALLGGGLPGPETPPLFLDAGRFRIESAGGADVGAFGLDVDVPAPVVWTNRDDLARVSRSGFFMNRAGLRRTRGRQARVGMDAWSIALAAAAGRDIARAE